MVNAPEALPTGDVHAQVKLPTPALQAVKSFVRNAEENMVVLLTSISSNLSKQEFKCGNCPCGTLIDQSYFQTS